jgi:hypothetical protein
MEGGLVKTRPLRTLASSISTRRPFGAFSGGWACVAWFQSGCEASSVLPVTPANGGRRSAEPSGRSLALTSDRLLRCHAGWRTVFDAMSLGRGDDRPSRTAALAAGGAAAEITRRFAVEDARRCRNDPARAGQVRGRGTTHRRRADLTRSGRCRPAGPRGCLYPRMVAYDFTGHRPARTGRSGRLGVQPGGQCRPRHRAVRRARAPRPAWHVVVAVAVAALGAAFYGAVAIALANRETEMPDV